MESNVVQDATTITYLRTEGSFVRTALIIDNSGQGGSVDVVNEKGDFLARINFFTNEDNSWLAVDVIDVQENFNAHNAITFLNGQRAIMGAGKMVGADFRKKDDE